MAMANAGTATAAKEVEDVVEGGEEEEGSSSGNGRRAGTLVACE